MANARIGARHGGALLPSIALCALVGAAGCGGGGGASPADPNGPPDPAPPPPPVVEPACVETADYGCLEAPEYEARRQTIEDALGYPIREARWSDPETFAPTLDDDEAAQIAGEISQSGGSNVLLLPDQSTGLKVISYD